MVIGIDKRNPLFTIYRDAKQGKVYIYYGTIHDFGHIYPRNKYSYSSANIKDIEKVYNVSLSPETLRPLFGNLKSAYNKDKMLSEETEKRSSRLTSNNNPTSKGSNHCLGTGSQLGYGNDTERDHIATSR